MLFMPLGVFLVLKTLEDRWYIVIKAYKFTRLFLTLIFDKFYCIVIYIIIVCPPLS